MNMRRFLTHSLQDARVMRILAAALDAVEPGKLVRNYLLNNPLPKHNNSYLLGIGKASEAMTFAAAETLTDFTDALAITKHASGRALERVAIIEGGHPIPDERSLAAGQSALEFVSRLNEDDLLICFISGGGSALVTAPKDGITLKDIQAATLSLLASGATINKINILRRQLDRIKGGGLARATKAQVISLILSDVLGNPLEVIASGLTVDPFLGMRVQNIIVGDITTAARSALTQAKREGFDAEIFLLNIQGEAREAGQQLAGKLKEERKKRHHPFCIIAGGETTVTLRGNGRGGRNQELALGTVDILDGVQDVLLISLATDGDDGPTDAAGAVVDGQTCQRAKRFGMFAADYLSRNDTYVYFQSLDDLIKPGYTGTNVNDLFFLIGL